MSPKPHQLAGPLQIGPLRIIPGPFYESWNLYRACSILIEDGERAIVDPGSDEDALAAIARQGVAININTHHHGDHMLFNPLFTAADLWLSAPEAETFGDLDKVALDYGCDAALLEVWKERIDEQERRAFLLPVARTLRDGERVAIGDTEIVFHLLPGHARGMQGLEFPRERLAYTADVGVIDRRERIILERLVEPRTRDELVAQGLLYPSRALENPWVRHWEEMHHDAHLARLEAQGAVIREEGGRWRQV